MIVYATAEFKRQPETLAHKNSYSDVASDVCNFLKDKDLQELHQMRDLIQNTTGTYSLNKYRIANSIMQRGKRGSYRCICACFPITDTIVLGAVYPKTGSDGVDNLPKEEYKRIAKSILQALESKELFLFDKQHGMFLKPGK